MPRDSVQVFRPVIDSEHIQKLRIKILKNAFLCNGIRNRCSAGPCRRKCPCKDPSEEQDCRKRENGGKPFPDIFFFFDPEDKKQHGQKDHVAFMGKTVQKIKQQCQVKIRFLLLFLRTAGFFRMQFPVQEKTHADSEEYPHCLHQPQKLSDLVIGKTGGQEQNAA